MDLFKCIPPTTIFGVVRPQQSITEAHDFAEGTPHRLQEHRRHAMAESHSAHLAHVKRLPLTSSSRNSL
jgi:hypothetical protein